MLLLLMGYGTAGAPPAIEIDWDNVSMAQNDVGLYVAEANIFWSVASNDLSLNTKKG